MFADAYDKCSDKVTWVASWLLCWPVKLTFVCNIVQALGGKSICNPDGKVDVGIGEGYVTLRGISDSIRDRLHSVQSSAAAHDAYDHGLLISALNESVCSFKKREIS